MDRSFHWAPCSLRPRTSPGQSVHLRHASWLLVLMTGLSGSSAAAAAPEVHFDVGAVVGCQDVTTEEFAALNPDERLVEARFQVSSLVRHGSEEDLIEYLYRIESPRRSVRVVDYQPKTTLESTVVGNVGIEDKQETTRHIGFALSGHYDKHLNGSATGDLGSKRNASVQYELLPPLELLAASGTIQRGSGVYYKLKPSVRTSLEGAKDFVLVLRVPSNWRGDYVHVQCEAKGYRRNVVRALDERQTCGTGQFVVALYLAGDEQAKHVATRFSRAESRLRRTVVLNRREIEKQAYPTVVHKVGAMLDVVEPQIPNGWMEQLIYQSVWNGGPRVAERLPASVRDAALEFSRAKQQLQTLGGDLDPLLVDVSSG